MVGLTYNVAVHPLREGRAFFVLLLDISEKDAVHPFREASGFGEACY